MQFRSVSAVVLAVPLLVVVVVVVAAAAVVEGDRQDRQPQREAQPVAPRVLVVALLPRLQAQELHLAIVVEKSAEQRSQTAP